MMKPTLLPLALGLVGMLAACGGGSLGPDEFEVVGRAPLVVPPERDLAPPRPGEPRAQEIDPGRQAFEALFPGQDFKPADPPSAGEQALLRFVPDAGGPDVRSNVAQRSMDVVKKRLVLAQILAADVRQWQPDNIEIERLASRRVTPR